MNSLTENTLTQKNSIFTERTPAGQVHTELDTFLRLFKIIIPRRFDAFLHKSFSILLQLLVSSRSTFP